MKKVEQFYSKNQFLINDTEKDELTFQSYNKTIAIFNGLLQTLTLGFYWDYSKTTSKHLYLFINERCCLPNLPNLDECKNKKQIIQNAIKQGFIQFNPDLE